ncbi:hypothetical protein [Paramagnetospirillum magneticum]|uniref:hypothetical protein n=1 Tax=Paramagnetospirillum magneticum TaxID=84159 RepID=UPI0011D15E64|nr:hypothetical protein [Paramagnetospirillum magneticum]
MKIQKSIANITSTLIPTIYSQGYMLATELYEDECEYENIMETLTKQNIYATVCHLTSHEIGLWRMGVARYLYDYYCIVFKRKSDAVRFKMAYSGDCYPLDMVYVIRRGRCYLTVLDTDFNTGRVTVGWTCDVNKAHRSYSNNSDIIDIFGAEYVAFPCTNGDLYHRHSHETLVYA